MLQFQRQSEPNADLRRYPRLRMSAPFACAFSRLGLQRWASTDRTGLGVVLDVSLRGAKVMSMAAMRPGDHLALSLRIPDQVTAMQVDAMVRWGNDQLFGLEFVSISQSAESRLKKFLTRRAIPCT
jgi:PilZ domain-containing protein